MVCFDGGGDGVGIVQSGKEITVVSVDQSSKRF